MSAAQVRFIEVSPGSAEMDFYVNGTAAAYGVGFESFTSYLPVNPGAATLSVNRAGHGQALASAQSLFGGGHQYTAVVSHGLSSLEEHVYADQDIPAPSGQTALRVLNEVEGSGPLMVYLVPTGANTSTTTMLSVNAGTSSPYTNLPATGEYMVTATLPERGFNVPVASVTVKATSGGVRSVVFAGVAPSAGKARVVGFSLSDVDAP